MSKPKLPPFMERARVPELRWGGERPTIATHGFQNQEPAEDDGANRLNDYDPLDDITLGDTGDSHGY